MTGATPTARRRRGRAFSLVEMLVVMAIIVIVASLVVPAVGTILRGTDLTRAGQMVGDYLGLARQTAVKTNRDVYVLFYQLPETELAAAGAPAAWRGMQLASSCQIDPATGKITITPAEKAIILPIGMELSESPYTGGTGSPGYSPLLTQAPLMGTIRLAGYAADARCRGFRFRANGSLDRAINLQNAFLTVVSSLDKGAAPKNYYTVLVNPITGTVKIFRP